MRDRLVAVLVGLTVAVVLLYGVPRAYFLADLVRDSESAGTKRSADLLAVAVAERSAPAREVTEEFLASLVGAQESIVLEAGDGTVVRAGASAAEESSDDLVETRSLPDGSQLTLRRSEALVNARTSDALLPLVLIGVALTALSAVVGVVLARRLARPFDELATVAAGLGRGRFDADVPHYRMAEAEAVGEALRRGSAQLAELDRRDREFAVHASHELRTPISALRLQIEDLASWPQTPADVAAELTSYLPELDRLAAAVREYLNQAQDRSLSHVDDVDLHALVDQAVQRWRPRFLAAGRELTRGPGGQLTLRTSPSVVEETVDLLLEDALARSGGRVTVDVDTTDAYARVRVQHLGGGVPPTAQDRNAGAEARRLAPAVGGRVSTQEATSTLLLPLGH